MAKPIINKYKKISDIPNYQSILDALKDPNLLRIHQLFKRYENSPEMLNGVLDAKDDNGQTLREIAKTALNKTYSFSNTYNNVTNIYQQTPLHSYFNNYHNDWMWHYVNDSDDYKKEFKLFLALGVEVNAPINDKGDTILHYMVRDRNQLDKVAIKMLVDGGADLYKKNDAGKTAIDLLSGPLKNYFIDYARKKNVTAESSALTLQRQWRKQKSKRAPTDKQGIEIETGLQRHPWPREPESNPIQPEELKAWIGSHPSSFKKDAKKVAESIQHIDYERFLFGLKQACKKFNEHLAALPPEQRNYILFVDTRENKSPAWVTKLAEQYLDYPPTLVVKNEKGENDMFFRTEPPANIQHVLNIEDASYSGNFLTMLSRSFYNSFTNKKLSQLNIHYIVPFMSAQAQERLSDFPITLHTHETIPKKIAGTSYTASTATYFDHKIPDSDFSAIAAIAHGASIGNSSRGRMFIKDIKPPYKQGSLKNEIQELIAQLPEDFAPKAELLATLKKRDASDFIQSYARFEHEIDALVGDKIKRLFPQLQHNPAYQQVKLQELLTRYITFLSEAEPSEKNAEKISILIDLSADLKKYKSPGKSLQHFIEKYTQQSPNLDYEAPLVKKKQRGVVNSFYKLFEPPKAKLNVEEEKIQQAIAKLLPQVNLIMPARKTRK